MRNRFCLLIAIIVMFVIVPTTTLTYAAETEVEDINSLVVDEDNSSVPDESVEVTSDLSVVVEPESEIISNVADSDDLFAEYVNRTFGIDYLESTSTSPAYKGEKLTGQNLFAYMYLMDEFGKVANGTRSNTQFHIPLSELGITATVYTAEELSDATGVTVNSIVENGSISNAAVQAMYALTTVDLRIVMKHMIATVPYELYWFDKTISYSYTNEPGGLGARYNYGKNEYEIYYQLDYVYINLCVAEEYSLTKSTGTYETDTALTSAATSSAANALEVIENHKYELDFEKLSSYKDYICTWVEYNHEAADNNNTPYGNPWQLIWAFDEDLNTGVVCEGYSKAFKFLCDQSVWHNSVSCILASGDLYQNGTNLGGHMWNIVIINGTNYIADITNTDNAGDELFLTGTNVGNGINSLYEFQMAGAGTIGYIYDSEVQNHYDEELVLSASDYDYSGEDHIWDEGEVTSTGNCMTPGVITYTCSICEETKTSEIYGGHDYTYQSFDDSNGIVVYECSMCGNTKTVNVTSDALSSTQIDLSAVMDSVMGTLNLHDTDFSVVLDIVVDNGIIGMSADGNETIIHEVQPMALVYVGSSLLGGIAIDEEQLSADSYTFMLSVPDTMYEAAFNNGDKRYVSVKHISSSNNSEQYEIQGEAGSRYVEVTTGSFGQFELEPVTRVAVGSVSLNSTLSLEEDISINFYVSNLKAGTNPSDYRVVYSFNGGTETDKTLDEIGDISTSGTSGVYKMIVAECAAKQMTIPVHFKIIYTGGESDVVLYETTDYSIQSYCLRIIDGTNNNEELVNLCKAVLDYGTSAQYYFNYRTESADTLANGGTYFTSLNDITMQEFSGSSSLQNDVTKLSMSLSLESKTEINYYVAGEGLSISGVTCDGESVTYTEVQQNDGSIWVRVADIAAKEMADNYTLTFNTVEGTNMVTYSPMIYAYRNRDAGGYLGGLCRSLYYYYRSASEYFN